MIPYFDKFVDTREKRYHFLLLLTLLSVLLLLLPYLLLGVKLTFLNSYDSLYEVLDKPYIEWTFISRVIVDFISLVSFKMSNILGCLISNLRMLDVVCILFVILSFGILERKRMFTICLSILVVEVLCCCWLAYSSLSAGSLQPVINNIRWMGMMMLLANTMVISLVIYSIITQIKAYLHAYQYVVIEVKEHVE